MTFSSTRRWLCIPSECFRPTWGRAPAMPNVVCLPLPALGSGPRYQILSPVFARCASQKTHGHARIARETENTRICENCTRNACDSRMSVCFLARAMCKKVCHKSYTSGNCLSLPNGEGQRRRGGVMRVGGGGRSDVGLGVAGWPDGACRDCTRRAATAAAEQRRRPPSSHRSSLLVSSRRAAPGRQKLCE